MTIDNLMKGLMQSAGNGQQSSGGDALSQALGGLMGSSSQGGNQTDQMLGSLEHIIGGRPGTGQPLPQNAGNVPVTGGAGAPAMALVPPIADKVANKAHIPPRAATIAAAIALHYLLASHPSSSAKAPMNLGSVMQQLNSGGVSHGTLQSSGMVSDVMQATDLDRQGAMQTLDAVFGTLASHVQGAGD